MEAVDMKNNIGMIENRRFMRQEYEFLRPESKEDLAYIIKEKENTMKEAIVTGEAPGAIGPYSQGIRAGNTVYVSGQTPVDPLTGSIPEGIVAQTGRGMKNVQAILKAAGCGMDDVVEVTVFLQDMNDFKAMNEVYKGYFSEPYPTRAAVEVARLPLDVLVEIKATAVLPG